VSSVTRAPSTPAALLEQAGLARMRVGGAEVSERDPNCVLIHPEATSRDVLRLVE